jgi:hypothetical protein
LTSRRQRRMRLRVDVDALHLFDAETGWRLP